MPFDVGDFVLPQETKPDVFSLEGLIAWLEKQPAETEYDWNDCGGCLLGQYLAANNSGMGSYSKLSDISVPILKEWGDVTYASYPKGTMALGQVACLSPHTFGAALSRARALLEPR